MHSTNRQLAIAGLALVIWAIALLAVNSGSASAFNSAKLAKVTVAKTNPTPGATHQLTKTPKGR